MIYNTKHDWNLHGHQTHGAHGHWQLFGPRVVGGVTSWVKVETGGTEIVGKVGTGVWIATGVVVGTVGRTVDPVIALPSQSRHSIGQGAGIGLTGDALHCDVYSWGWTQRWSW